MKLSHIYEAINELTPKKNLTAAFDADGTLWDTDVGDAFFEFECMEGYFGMGKKTIRDFYHFSKSLDDNSNLGYLWLNQIHAGLTEEEVRKAAKVFFGLQKQFPYFQEMKNLISFMQEKRVEIYIVSASIRYALEPFVNELNIKPENLIAIETSVENGKITEQAVFPIPYKAGKAEAIKLKLKDQELDFAFGNTTGDLALLQSAKIPTVISSNSEKSFSQKNSEATLAKFAQEKNWPIVIF